MFLSMLILSILPLAKAEEVKIGNMRFLQGCKDSTGLCIERIVQTALGEDLGNVKDHFVATALPQSTVFSVDLEDLRRRTMQYYGRGVLEILCHLFPVKYTHSDAHSDMVDALKHGRPEMDLTPFLQELIVNIATPILYRRTLECIKEHPKEKETCIKESGQLFEWFGLTKLPFDSGNMTEDKMIFYFLQKVYLLAFKVSVHDLRETDFNGLSVPLKNFAKTFNNNFGHYALSNNSNTRTFLAWNPSLTTFQSIRLAIMYGKTLKRLYDKQVSLDAILEGLWPPILGERHQYDPEQDFLRKKNVNVIELVAKPDNKPGSGSGEPSVTGSGEPPVTESENPPSTNADENFGPDVLYLYSPYKESRESSGSNDSSDSSSFDDSGDSKDSSPNLIKKKHSDKSPSEDESENDRKEQTKSKSSSTGHTNEFFQKSMNNPEHSSGSHDGGNAETHTESPQPQTVGGSRIVQSILPVGLILVGLAIMVALVFTIAKLSQQNDGLLA